MRVLNPVNLIFGGLFGFLALSCTSTPLLEEAELAEDTYEAEEIIEEVREIAVTIDDLPVVGFWEMTPEAQRAVFNNVTDIFAKFGIKSEAFVVGKDVGVLPASYLDSFVSRGHTLHNHTFSHFNLNEKTVEEFIEDIEKGEKAILRWQKGTRYFRYPMLVQGDTLEKRRAVEDYLRAKKYTIAPVTIDTSDWKYNEEFSAALKVKDFAKANEVGQAYIDNVKKNTDYAEKLSRGHLGRQVRHILLIHMNHINSAYLAQILDWYRENGWKFISLEEALQDPVYAQKDNYLGKWGTTWLQMLFGDNIPTTASAAAKVKK